MAQSLVSLALPGAKFLGVHNGRVQGRMAEGDLLYNILYRAVEIVSYQEGFEEGLRQTMQWALQVLVLQVQKRFPVLTPLAERQTALVKDSEALYKVIDAETVEEARRVLEEAHQGQ